MFRGLCNPSRESEISTISSEYSNICMAEGNGYAWFHLVIMKDTCEGCSCVSLATVADVLKISRNIVLQFSCLISVCITCQFCILCFKP